MAVAQLLLSMEPKYICHNQCTMGTSSPIVPKLSTEILLIPAILELYHKPPLKAHLHMKCHNLILLLKKKVNNVGREAFFFRHLQLGKRFVIL